MRWPRVRLSVRLLMVVVAVVAVVAGLMVRSGRMREMAERHRAEAAMHSVIGPVGIDGGMVEIWDNDGMWHRAMAEKYERAARYPWLPVWPEPVEPEPVLVRDRDGQVLP